MLHYAAGTVQICAAAVAAIHALNGMDNPLSGRLKLLLKAIQAVGICGAKSKKTHCGCRLCGEDVCHVCGRVSGIR